MRGFNLEDFRTIAAAEVQGSQSKGTLCPIGRTTNRDATYLHKVWLDEGLFRAFINAEKLEEFVLSSPRVSVLTVTNSGIIRADAYANPKDPPYSEPGLCACCGQELDKHWVRAHIEGRGPFPAHSECWKKWCEANYPQGVYGPWLALMNENKSLFVKSLVQSIDSYGTEHDGPSSATPRAKRRRSLIDDPLAPTGIPCPPGGRLSQGDREGRSHAWLQLSQDFRFGSSDGTSLHPHPAKRNHFSTRKRRRLRRDRSSPLLAPHGG